MTAKSANTKNKTLNTRAMVAHVQGRLKEHADPVKALEMAAYMKTDMPFYGVQKPDREPIIKELKANFAPASQADYEAAVLALWRLKHREEKYMAINYAGLFRQYVSPASLPLYERLIREGQWWDFVDAISSDLLGGALLNYPQQVRPVVEDFSNDNDFWIRRASLLAHLGHKKETSHKHLFAYCKKMAHEKEFFIRKGIGWALREYSKSEPERVVRFLRENRTTLSPLSLREGAKHLAKVGLAGDLLD
jgi:3-methyladenine DNA glycosylase AlkD